MASFWFLMPLIIALMSSPLPSLSKELDTSTLSTAPAVLPGAPLSPYTDLSPDIAPLLPSPGGVVPSPSGSSMPTIPSNPSPPNPDEVSSVGPDTALPPSGSLPASSTSSLSSVWSMKLAILMGLLAYSSALVFSL